MVSSGSRAKRARRKLRAYRFFLEFEAIQRWVGAAALGVALALGFRGSQIETTQLTIAFLSVFLILCYVMAVDDYFDRGVDKLHLEKEKKRVVMGRISLREARVVVVLLLVIGLSLSLLVSLQFAVIEGALVILSTLYTAPPIRYKNAYPFSTLGEMTGSFLPLLGGFTAIAPLQWSSLVVALVAAVPTFFENTYWRFWHECRMVDFNRLTGKKTFAVIHGVEFTNTLKRTMFFLALVATGLLVIAGPFSVAFKLSLLVYEWLALTLPYQYLLRRVPPLRNVVAISWGFIFLVVVIVIALGLG
jgi:4-hydroxybenzoate polyprenyltransferase